MKIEFVDDGKPCVVQRTLAVEGGWHLLIGCLMLNRTRREVAEKAMEELFEVIPIYEYAVDDKTDWERVKEIIRPCGLWKKRLQAIKELSQDYARGKKVEDIRHCGKYAVDSWKIFVDVLDLSPEDVDDPELKKYLKGK